VPIPVELPVSAARIRALRAGDELLLSGRIATAREAAQRRLAARDEPAVRAVLQGGAVYHCGPVVAPEPGGGWRVLAAGPSPSAAAEPWEAAVIARYGVRAVLGKGPVGPATRDALREHGAVFLRPAGALAVTLARRIVRVRGVHLLDELGVTDAVWDLEVTDFPALVLVDAQGDAVGDRGAEAAPLSGAGA
jgi:tartrate/fumarate subfamily iron-sulfur-dependent hydro-lyase beta chain